MLCNNNLVTLAIEFLHFYVPVELFLKSPPSLPQKPGVWNFILVLSQENKDPGERLPYENNAVLIVSMNTSGLCGAASLGRSKEPSAGSTVDSKEGRQRSLENSQSLHNN